MKSVAVFGLLFSLGVAVSAALKVIPIETQPRSDDAAVFVCSSEKPLQSCLIKPPYSDEWIVFTSGNITRKTESFYKGAKYLYYGDGLSEGDCGVIIPQPKPQDNGIWLCKTQAIGETNDTTGEVNIKLGNDAEGDVDLVLKREMDDITGSSEEDDEKDTKLTLVPVDVESETGGSIVFVCQVNKPLEACLVRPPNSQQWIVVNNSDVAEKEKLLQSGARFLYYGDGFDKGDCGIVIPRPLPEDQGKWMCKTQAVGDPVSLSEEVEIKVADTKLHVIPVDVQPQEGESLVFVCQLNKPLGSCMIQRPNSEEWIIFTNVNTMDQQKMFESGHRYLYYGDGLEKGDCGIVVVSPQPEDSGAWKCKARAAGDSLSLIDEIRVKVAPRKGLDSPAMEKDIEVKFEIEESQRFAPWMVLSYVLLGTSVMLLVAVLIVVAKRAIMSRSICINFGKYNSLHNSEEKKQLNNDNGEPGSPA